MSTYNRRCDCEDEQTGTRWSTGKNLFGKKVTALVADMKCTLCGKESVKVIQADKRYAK
jgi:hypothetical protein